MAGRTILPVFLCLLWIPACFSSAANPDRRLSAEGRKCACETKGASISSSIEKGDLKDSRNTPATSPRRGGTVAIRILREPTSLLSLVDSDPIVGGMINHAVLETLVRIDEDGTTVIPELADHFETDEASLKYTFHLAEDARWHDGRPVTATDVKFVFGKLIEPFSPLSSASIFTSVADVDTPDDETVVFTLDRRMPDFLKAVATVPILPMHVFGRTPLSLHEASRAPVGSGPYRFVRWAPSRLIELERNPDWRGTPPYLDEVRYVIVPDNRIAADMFAHGDLDIIWDFPIGAAPPEKDARVIAFALPFLETWLYNRNRSVFQEAAIRRATAMLIDRKTIRCALECRADSAGEPPLSERPDGEIFKALPFDPQRAQSLLDKAGWKKNARGSRTKQGRPLAFSLLVPNLGRDMERSAVIIQEEMAGAGIDMKIVIVSRGAFMGRLGAGRFDVAAVPAALSGVDEALSLFHSKGGFFAAFGGATDPVIDNLIDKFRSELSAARKQELQTEISARLGALHPASFLYRAYGAALVRNTVSGIHIREGRLDVTRVFRVRGNK